VVKAVIRRNISPPDIVRKMKRTLPVLEGRMKEVGAHFDNYEPLLFERADAFKYTGDASGSESFQERSRHAA
jgi:hypothetical protein